MNKRIAVRPILAALLALACVGSSAQVNPKTQSLTAPYETTRIEPLSDDEYQTLKKLRKAVADAENEEQVYEQALIKIHAEDVFANNSCRRLQEEGYAINCLGSIFYQPTVEWRGRFLIITNGVAK